jgi:zinc protease
LLDAPSALAPSPTAPLGIRTVKLENGLRVVVCESRGAPVVALQVWVEVGSADEKPEEGGLAHVHEHMLFKGTARRPVGAIASEIEAAGGEINAWTSYDQTVYHVVMASAFFDAGLDILADAIQSSAFDRAELARELEVILEEIKRSEDQPTSRTSRALFETAFSVHPYSRAVIGRSEVVAGFTRESVLAFFNAHYRTERMTIVCVGDIDADQAIAKIERAFASCAKEARALTPRVVEPEQTAPRVRGLTDDVTESHVAIGWKCPPLGHPDTAAVDVLAVILGQGTSSRLVEEIREKRALVNEVYAYGYTPRDAGLFVVGASLSHEKIDDAVRAIGAEITRLIEDGVTSEELHKARTILSSDAIYQRETAEGLARRLGYWVTMTGDASFEAQYQARVRGVSANDVIRVAREMLTAARATFVALVPKAESARVADAPLLALVDAAFPRREAPMVRANKSPARVLTALSTGARLVVERDTTNPIVAIRTAWLGGGRAETRESAGHSHLLAEMLTRGTTSMTASEIARAVDTIAGQLDGYAGRNSLGLRATFLREHLDRGLDLLVDSMRHPAFAPDELSRTIELTIEEIRSRQDNAAGLCFELFGRALWLSHPYRRELLGTEESIGRVTPTTMRAFFERHIDPSNVVICVVGDVDPDAIAARMEDATQPQAFRALPESAWTPAAEPTLDAPRVVRLVRDRAQAHVVMGTRGLTLDEKGRFPLEVLCAILSGQGGRLFLELRDKQSLCYSVSAFSVEGLDPGSFSVYIGTSPDKVERALAGIDGVLKRLLDDGISDAELQRAQRYLIGTHDIGLQRLGARATTMSLNVLYGLGYDSHLAYDKRVSAVTREDVLAVARRLFVDEKRVTAIVGPEGTPGPAATMEPPLS